MSPQDFRRRMIKGTPIEEKEAHIWGGTWDTLPTHPGIAIMFEPELAKPDREVVPSVISTYFMKSLGSTGRECLERLDSIRSAWGNIAESDQGLVYSHLFYCIDVCIRTQTRPFVLLNKGVYEGTVLLGAGYEMTICRKIFGPVPHATLIKDLQNSGSHNNSLRLICEILETPVDGVENMRTLATIIKQKNVRVQDRQKILDWAKHLNFPVSFWKVNTDSVLAILRLLSEPTGVLAVEEPMHYSALFCEDRETNLLSVFGSTAPTFEIGGAKTLKLSANPTTKKIICRFISLSSAVLDFKSIKESGVFHNDPDTVPKSYTTREFRGKDMQVVLRDLQRYCSVLATTETTSSSSGVIAQSAEGFEW